MTSDRGLDPLVRSWLHEDRHEDASRILEIVLDGVPTTQQHRPRWSVGGTLTMNKFVTVGLGTAAMVAVLLIGANLMGSPGPGPGGGPSASAVPSEASSSVEPSSPRDVGLRTGRFVWSVWGLGDLIDGPVVKVTIPASGWTCSFVWRPCALWKGDVGGGAGWWHVSQHLPESALIVTSMTRGIVVYDDACHWRYLPPSNPGLTTADEIAAALAAQPGRNASVPMDVTIGGYHGKMVTLRVPDDAVFDACYRGLYASYTFAGEGEGGEPWRYHQGPGQIDTFWIVDVDGATVIIDAMYRADTPVERIAEMQSIAESATFE